ncbi:Protein CBG26283 [Caenorhabditis briggsae]|uniref:Protein CBG26283 n=1 Tax=Caenorhabditis briggsae TaxID=6238 RepID=B6ILY1_CAEBR|nr:Protein CBG26283 [Caenorhabditis briggsae]CAS00911.1 Protein CBG26283 [Caenorhabditis briggsae]
MEASAPTTSLPEPSSLVEETMSPTTPTVECVSLDLWEFIIKRNQIAELEIPSPMLDRLEFKYRIQGLKPDATYTISLLLYKGKNLWYRNKTGGFKEEKPRNGHTETPPFPPSVVHHLNGRMKGSEWMRNIVAFDNIFFGNDEVHMEPTESQNPKYAITLTARHVYKVSIRINCIDDRSEIEFPISRQKFMTVRDPPEPVAEQTQLEVDVHNTSGPGPSAFKPFPEAQKEREEKEKLKKEQGEEGAKKKENEQ